jgi:hypothetical protein
VGDVEGPASLASSGWFTRVGDVGVEETPSGDGAGDFLRLRPPAVVARGPKLRSSAPELLSPGGGEENQLKSELSTFSACFLFLALLVPTPTNGYNLRPQE